MAYRPLGYASFSTRMMTFQHIPKGFGNLPKQEQPSVFPTSFSILGGVGWLQPASQLKIHQPPNKDSKKMLHYPSFNIMSSCWGIMSSFYLRWGHNSLKRSRRLQFKNLSLLLDSSCQTSSKCMLFTQTFHTRFVLSGTFPWENKGTRSRRSSSVTSSHGSLPKTGRHVTWPRWNHMAK